MIGGAADDQGAVGETERSRRVLVIIPALNESETVASVVRQASALIGADVLVIDDGSIDDTGARARAAGAQVLTLPFNVGVGAAIKVGVRYAHERGYEATLQLDGDGQHEAADAHRLLEAIWSGADIAVGSRFAAGYDVRGLRRASMRILAALIRRRLGTTVADTTSGFRALGPRALDLFSEAYPTDYLSDTVEALWIAGGAGLRVVEIDVRMRGRQGGVASSGAAKSSYHLVRMLLGLAVRSVRPTTRRKRG